MQTGVSNIFAVKGRWSVDKRNEKDKRHYSLDFYVTFGSPNSIGKERSGSLDGCDFHCTPVCVCVCRTLKTISPFVILSPPCSPGASRVEILGRSLMNWTPTKYMVVARCRTMLDGDPLDRRPMSSFTVVCSSPLPPFYYLKEMRELLVCCLIGTIICFFYSLTHYDDIRYS